MTVEEVFDHISRAKVDEKWDAADYAMSKYDGPDRDLIMSQIGEFISAKVIFHAEE